MNTVTSNSALINLIDYVLNNSLNNSISHKFLSLIQIHYPKCKDMTFVIECLSKDSDYTYHLCQDLRFIVEFDVYCERVYNAVQHFIRKNDIYSDKYGGCREMYLEYDSSKKSLYESVGVFKVEELLLGFKRRGTKEDPRSVFTRCNLPSFITILNTLLFHNGVSLGIVVPHFAIGDRRFMFQLTW
jgi:hypothetical protein